MVSMAAEAVKLEALVLGGGPAGLAAATMLARKGWSDVTLLERRGAAGTFERQLGVCASIL